MDNELWSSHYIEFEQLDEISSYWIRRSIFARSFECDSEYLLVVGQTGRKYGYTFVRNIVVRPVAK